MNGAAINVNMALQFRKEEYEITPSMKGNSHYEVNNLKQPCIPFRKRW